MKVNQGEIPATPFGTTFRIGNFGLGPAVSRPRNSCPGGVSQGIQPDRPPDSPESARVEALSALFH